MLPSWLRSYRIQIRTVGLLFKHHIVNYSLIHAPSQIYRTAGLCQNSAIALLPSGTVPGYGIVQRQRPGYQHSSPCARSPLCHGTTAFLPSGDMWNLTDALVTVGQPRKSPINSPTTAIPPSSLRIHLCTFGLTIAGRQRLGTIFEITTES